MVCVVKREMRFYTVPFDSMIALIMTVYNEENVLPEWVKSFCQQTLAPDEVVIVDGGSTDGTWAYLQSLVKTGVIKNLKIFQFKSNIAAGRNYAINQSQADIIVATDAGCTYAPNWFESLISPIKKGAKFSTTAFGPWFIKHDSWLVRAIAACTIPISAEFASDWWPSSRSVAFLREIWQNVGGYPEWIPFCEDVIFDRAIKAQGVEFFFVRTPLVFWRPRLTLFAYLRQVFNYTRSEGQARLNLKRHILRILVYALILSAGFWGGWFNLIWVLWFSYAVRYLRRGWNFRESILASPFSFILILYILFFGDGAKIIGGAVGMFESAWSKIKTQKNNL